MSCLYQIRREISFPINTPCVIKTHFDYPTEKEYKLTSVNKTTTLVSVTTPGKRYTIHAKARLKKDGYNVGVVQNLQTLAQIQTEGFVKQYADFFHVPSHQRDSLLEYIALWDVLSMCCGVQMSKYRRNELLPPSKKNLAMKAHLTCASYDIDDMAQKFMGTDLYALIDKYEGIKGINRPSLMDEALVGTYCSRYNEWVQKKGVEANLN